MELSREQYDRIKRLPAAPARQRASGQLCAAQCARCPCCCANSHWRAALSPSMRSTPRRTSPARSRKPTRSRCWPSKGNHPLLHQEVRDFLLDAEARNFAGVAHDFFEEADKGHGRLDIRRHWITGHFAWITAPHRVGGVAVRGPGRARAAHSGRNQLRASILPLLHRTRRPALCPGSLWPLGRGKLPALALGRDLPRRPKPSTHPLCRRQLGCATQTRPQRGPDGPERQGRRQRQTLPHGHQ